MTRRDTIISAALINAGLLVVLFVCALGIDEGSQANAHSAAMTPAVHTAAQVEQATDPAHDLVSHVQEIALEETSAPVAESVKSETPSSPHWIQIEVQKGDRVDKIASRYGMSVEDLLQANQLQTTQLVVGQSLRVLSSDAIKTAEVKAEQIAFSAPKVAAKEIQAKKETVKTSAQPSSKQSVASNNKAASQPVTTHKAPVQSVTSNKSTAQPVASNKSAAKPTTSPDGSVQYHYVQRGESPWVIAKKYGLSVEKLLKLNNLDEATARRLREGDRLRVR